MFEKNFDTIEEAIRAIKATVDDVDSLTVYLSQLLMDDEGNSIPEVGVILHYCNGRKGFISRAVASYLLNDGVLSRLHVPIEYV